MTRKLADVQRELNQSERARNELAEAAMAMERRIEALLPQLSDSQSRVWPSSYGPSSYDKSSSGPSNYGPSSYGPSGPSSYGPSSYGPSSPSSYGPSKL